MTRMSKEFSLVLLGAGILSTGYFLWPEEGLEAKEKEQAAQQVAGGRTHMRGGMHFIPIFLSTGRPTGGIGSSTTAGIARGGFGSIGRGVSGVS